MISLNLKRRHLNESQRAMVAEKLANFREGRPSETAQICAVSQAQSAELLNVSRRAVQSAKTVRRDAAPNIIHAVERGEVAVSAAVAAIKSEPDKDKQSVWSIDDIRSAAKAERQKIVEERGLPTPAEAREKARGTTQSVLASDGRKPLDISRFSSPLEPIY